MIHMNMRYQVEDVNQVYLNLNDLLQLLEEGEEEIRFLKPEGCAALEVLEETMLELGIHALTGATKDTIDSITRML